MISSARYKIGFYQVDYRAVQTKGKIEQPDALQLNKRDHRYQPLQITQNKAIIKAFCKEALNGKGNAFFEIDLRNKL